MQEAFLESQTSKTSNNKTETRCTQYQDQCPSTQTNQYQYQQIQNKEPINQS